MSSGAGSGMCLLLGATGVGKTLLVKRLQKLSSRDGKGDLGDPPLTRPTFMVDASNPTQLSASCVQLLGLLSAEELAEASVLILFNKMYVSESDLPCYMTIEEMKSLIRLPDLIACAKQNITTVEISARKGTGLSDVLRWLQDTHRTNG
ncbi:ADP-ribosylation factor-like protein 16 isoform X3 [Cervus elaphus]|uniref:ADP-ribosylation factor-like protein 16 isoform X3 n=1 Tax=Cervus canadensis TaxID=1574408 RepID=UPI001C9E4F48|nr:ADP-ribosylation factor-like protein 16 isoform X3 [Cervus canadensis]XP_043761150.1 ADP-ribosylation factor-like protein 16 isoform X3 [Cervus elaphus]